jgi:hypothetical protein
MARLLKLWLADEIPPAVSFPVQVTGVLLPDTSLAK